MKKFNKFIPHSTTQERLAVLKGKLDIKELEKLNKKRSRKAAQDHVSRLLMTF